MEWEKTGDKISTVFAICMFIVLISFPLLTLYLLQKNFGKLKDEKAMNTYGALYLELKTDNRSALLYHVFYMLRRMILAALA
jgi:hypothetical protein